VIVHKFGGSSLATADHFKNGLEILGHSKDQAEQKIVVLSAPQGITQLIVDISENILGDEDKTIENKNQLRDKLKKIANELFESEEFNKKAWTQCEVYLSEIESLWNSLKLTRRLSPTNLDVISGYGELFSCCFFNNYLLSKNVSVATIDAREFLTIEELENHQPFQISWEESKQRLLNRFKETEIENTEFIVIPGYVARTTKNEPTTLKRNGSDWSAAIIANLVDASSLYIWTDVDGVLSADPKIVNNTFVVPELSYNEASELAHFGANVLHPNTIEPVREKNIPLFIKNSLFSDHQGTKVYDQDLENKEANVRESVKGLALIKDVALLNLEGSGMMGVPGIAEKLFHALREANVSVILISQGSSEQSICVVVPREQGSLAQRKAHHAFQTELSNNSVKNISLDQQVSVVTIVGDGMAFTPGVAATLFSSLSNSLINVISIAQGASERSISVVIKDAEVIRAMRTIHSGFYLSTPVISIGLIGPGLVGSTFLKQIDSMKDELKQTHGLDIRVNGIINSQQGLVSETGINLSQWNQELQKSKNVDLNQFLDGLQSFQATNQLIVDCSSSEGVSEKYIDIFHHNFHLATANKKGLTSSMSYYESLKAVSKKYKKLLLYETTVGAGLPIISSLRDLMNTGDKIKKIEGVFSGTISYIFNELSQTDETFSQVVMKAKEQGFTEPDPRDDLNGHDFARKVLILARELGVKLEFENVKIDPLIPEEFLKMSKNDFMDNLAQMDQNFMDLKKEAASKNNVLRYVGSVDLVKKEFSVSLKKYPQFHILSQLKGADNILLVQTERYDDNPLIIRGPGAGPDVTAGGVFSEVLRLASFMGVS
jgi:bifunctional aspartokinase / homoserine dehydrogenase 1